MVRDRFIGSPRFMVLALLCALVLLPDLAAANQFKRIRDVNVSCSNSLSCDIYITNPRVTLQTFGLRRRASQSADTSIYISMREPLQAGSDIQFQIDDVTIAQVPVSAFSYRAATYEYIYSDADDVLAVLKAMRRGQLLEISYTTKAGRSTAPFSLSGTTAGLIFADEVQGRMGRDDALMAITAEQRSNPEANSSADVLRFETWGDVPEALYIYFGTDNHLCSNEIGASDAQIFGGEQLDLGPNTALVTLPCGNAGAYNFPQAHWLKRGDVFTPLALPIMTEAGPSTTFVAWNSVFDAPTRTLSSFFKGRGLGDCGTELQWLLADDGFDVAFVLTSMRVKDECDGIYKEDFSDYQQLWPQP